jgi:lipopolysaccharide transport system ATP-binding protein
MPSAYKYLTTEDTECTEAEAKVRLAGQAGAEFSNPSASGLARGSENTSLIRAANNLRSSGDQTGSDSASAKIGEIFGKNAEGLDSEHGLRAGEFWAVQDVSFELRRGECLGLIGHNGAGKTTLLKMLNGLIKPDRGTITMRGRVGALIALGAGFNPILTGRENIYINGSVLGLTKKEIDEKIDEIIDFAEIREFIDMSVQSYSSGMSVRLGFAVASSMEPDVLIIDEVLAVGDFSFRKKCYERISQLLSKSAVIFVSHQMEQIKRLCRSGLLLEKGSMDKFGSISEVASVYEEKLAGKNETSLENFFSTSISGGVVEIQDRVINFRDNLNIIFNLNTNKKLAKLLFRIAFVSINGEIVAEWSSNNANNYSIDYHDNTISGSILIMKLPIKPGKYKIIFMVNDINNTHYIAVFKKGLGIEIEGDKTMNHYVQLFS